DANRCEQTDKGKPDLLVLEDHAVILEIIEQTLIAEAFHVMAGDVVDGLGSVIKSEQSAIYKFADAGFEAGIVVSILAQNHVSQNAFEVLIPQAVKAVLLQQSHGNRQLLAYDQEALVGTAGGSLRGLPTIAPESSRIVFELLHEVVVHDVVDAVHADSINSEIQHPAS